MKKIVMMMMLISSATAQDIGPSFGCYIQFSDTSKCYQVDFRTTELGTDSATLTQAQIIAKYGGFMGTFVNRCNEVALQYELELEALDLKARKLKRLCGSKCKKVK